MKELEIFRKFLAEGEAKGFTFWFREKAEKQLEKAKEVLNDKGISFTSSGKMAIDFPASADEKEMKSIMLDNGITQYVIANIKEEKSLNENIDQIFKDTYDGWADGYHGDPDDVASEIFDEEGQTSDQNDIGDRIPNFRAMQAYLRKNKEFVHIIPGYTDDLGAQGKFTYEDTKIVFTLEPNGKDIKMVSGPVSKMK